MVRMKRSSQSDSGWSVSGWATLISGPPRFLALRVHRSRTVRRTLLRRRERATASDTCRETARRRASLYRSRSSYSPWQSRPMMRTTKHTDEARSGHVGPGERTLMKGPMNTKSILIILPRDRQRIKGYGAWHISPI
jgi:hypothetical protein